MTPEQARKLCRQAGAPLPEGMHEGNFEKVTNTRRKVVDGISFRSTLEADVYQLLKAWENCGAIRELVCQPKYVLSEGMRLPNGKWQRPVTYIADFSFERFVSLACANHWTVQTLCAACQRCSAWFPTVIDAKGFRMEVYKIKAKLFRSKFPHIVFQEWDRETLKQNGG